MDKSQGQINNAYIAPVGGPTRRGAIDEEGRMGPMNLSFVRFMDDWVVLAPTRWKLRRAVRLVNETLDQLKVQQHPDKTFVCRVAAGFEFLGYRFSTGGLVGVAKATCEQFAARVNQLYEQGANTFRIGQYVQRWRRWVSSGLRVVAPGVQMAYGEIALDTTDGWPATPSLRMV